MCEVACSSFHFGAVSPSLSRIRVAKLEHAGLDLAVTCTSCREKPCLECPTAALSVGARGDIVLDAELCEACGVCAEACPIGAVGLLDGRPLFCDLCGGDPCCVEACPSRALSGPDHFRDGSLRAFLPSGGRPAERRALYAGALGEPLRRSWACGTRVDS